MFIPILHEIIIQQNYSMFYCGEIKMYKTWSYLNYPNVILLLKYSCYIKL